MIGKLPKNNQRDLFRPMFKDFINPGHELALLADAIERQYFENEFKPYYSGAGAPSVPIRATMDYLILKYLYNPKDGQIPEYWVRDGLFSVFLWRRIFRTQIPV